MKIHSLTLSLALALTASAPLIARAQGNANPLLVFTEHSSTLLDATVGGSAFGSVALISPDHWLWSLPSTFPTVQLIVEQNSTTYWLEPESTPGQKLGNWVSATFPTPTTGGADIRSDFDFTAFANPSIPDGAVSSAKFTFYFPSGGSATFDVQFIDLGDKADHVPDASSTISLLFLSGIGMLGAARVRRFHRS